MTPSSSRTGVSGLAGAVHYGYLYGEPGAYGLTEKGQQYGVEQYNDNGYGGYAARSWETRTWNDGLAGALRADMTSHPEGIATADPSPEEVASDSAIGDATFVPDHHDNSSRISGRQTAAVVGVAVVVGTGVLAARLVKPFWHSKVKPAARRIREKLMKQEAPEVAPADAADRRSSGST